MKPSRHSTEDNPLFFFDSFFSSGLSELYNDFFALHRASNADLFSVDNASTTQADVLQGRWSVTDEETKANLPGVFHLFIDELNSRLKEDQEYTLKAINNYVLNGKKTSKVNRYLNVLTTALLNLYQEHSANPIVKQYPIIQCYLLTTIEKMYQRSTKLFPELKMDENTEHLLNRHFRTELNSASTSFQTNLPYISLLDSLFNDLITNEFIDPSTSKEDFKRAFTGLPMTEQKIRWVKLSRNRQYISKPTIFHLIEKLQSEGIISEESPTNIKIKIPLIFVDQNGNRLENIQEAFSDYKKNRKGLTKDDSLIDEFISRLKN